MTERVRANYLPITGEYLLDAACRVVREAYDSHPFLVGSSMLRADYRDVDVRLILDDQDFARRFPGVDPDDPHSSRFWRLTCTALSLFLGQQSGLPVDFQIQQMTAANRDFNGRRSALGMRPDVRKP